MHSVIFQKYTPIRGINTNTIIKQTDETFKIFNTDKLCDINDYSLITQYVHKKN